MSAPDPVLLVHAVDGLDGAARLLDGIHAIALGMAEEGVEGGPALALAEIALTMMRRMDKVRRDIEKYRHALYAISSDIRRYSPARPDRRAGFLFVAIIASQPLPDIAVAAHPVRDTGRAAI